MSARFAAVLLPALLLAADGPLPNPAVDEPRAASKGTRTAVFAGGCVWCTEAVFEQVAGVRKVVSGYAGGDAASANYKLVSEGKTTHAEAIEITYDPSAVTYGQLLSIFFGAAHDPTQLDRQGPDWGKQYRSAVFPANEEHKRIAAAYIDQLTKAHAFGKPIVTLIAPGTKFHGAEDYHQDFVRKNPDHPYVVRNALPKVAKLKSLYPAMVKK